MTTIPPDWKTIDNLGIEPSVTWAQLRELSDKEQLSQAAIVTPFTETLIASPVERREIDRLFDSDRRNVPFALFCPPAAFPILKITLFTHLIIPSLGTREEQEEKAKKILDFKTETEMKEKEILVNLFHSLGILDKNLLLANEERGRYHKG